MFIIEIYCVYRKGLFKKFQTSFRFGMGPTCTEIKTKPELVFLDLLE